MSLAQLTEELTPKMTLNWVNTPFIQKMESSAAELGTVWVYRLLYDGCTSTYNMHCDSGINISVLSWKLNGLYCQCMFSLHLPDWCMVPQLSDAYLRSSYSAALASLATWWAQYLPLQLLNAPLRSYLMFLSAKQVVYIWIWRLFFFPL